MWALVKKKLKWMCSTLYEYIPGYLDEFTWLRNFGKDQKFEQLLKDIAVPTAVKLQLQMAPLGANTY